MASVSVELRNVEGTEAAMGWAAGHTIVVDRPAGRAGGRGLGFNGAELLSLAIGGCFCNDLRYVAHDMGVRLGKIAVTVEVEMVGEPLLTTAAVMTVSCQMLDGSDPQRLIEKTRSISMVANSVGRGFPVSVQAQS